MAYVSKKSGKVGTKLQVEVRGKRRPATVTKMPFVPAKYYTPPATATTVEKE
jgi:aminomethyltransferase